MKLKTFCRHIALWPACGMAVGLFMAGVMISHGMNDLVRASPTIGGIYDVIHYPARGLVFLWVWLRLPLAGDDGFILLPYSVVAQWTLIGAMIAIIIYFRRRGAASS